MVSGDVLNGSRSLIDPLVNAVLGVQNGHGGERGGQVRLNEVVSVGLPGVRVPVVAQSRTVSIISIACRGRIGTLRRVAAGGGGRIAAVRRSFSAARKSRNAHQHCQKQSKCLFHVVTSLTFPMKTDGGPKHS